MSITPSTMRRACLLCAIALLPATASAGRRAPPPAVEPAPTARMVIEKQLAATPEHAPGISGIEATRIRELYLQRMGQKLQPEHEVTGSRSGS